VRIRSCGQSSRCLAEADDDGSLTSDSLPPIRSHSLYGVLVASGSQALPKHASFYIRGRVRHSK
jgi:hypothetical protein